MFLYGAEYRNRTDDTNLEGWSFTIKLIPHIDMYYSANHNTCQYFFYIPAISCSARIRFKRSAQNEAAGASGFTIGVMLHVPLI